MQIFKVQLPLVSNVKKLFAYIYNRDRSVEIQTKVGPELSEKVKGQMKQYFYGTMEDGRVVLKDPAPWQDW